MPQNKIAMMPVKTNLINYTTRKSHRYLAQWNIDYTFLNLKFMRQMYSLATKKLGKCI